MGEFRKIPPNDDFRHTLEVNTDGPGKIEVFLDGIEVKGLTHLNIQVDPEMAYPEVTMSFVADSVTLDGMMATRHVEFDPLWDAKPPGWRPFPKGAAAASPPERSAASGRIPWSDPSADPISDLTRAKEAMEKAIGIPYDRAVLPDGTVLSLCPTCAGRGCAACIEGWVKP